MNKTKWAMAVLSFILVFVVAFLLIPPGIKIEASEGSLSIGLYQYVPIEPRTISNSVISVSEDEGGASVPTSIIDGGITRYYPEQPNYSTVIDDEPVAGSTDDAHEKADTGAVDVTNNNVFMRASTTEGSRYWGGYRWEIAIPQGANITSAWATFYFTPGDDPNTNFHFEYLASPETFSTATSNISGRDRTSNSTLWSEPNIGAGWKDTPSLVAPLQEVVDAYTTSYIALIARPSENATGYGDVYAWDYDDNSRAALISIEYTEAEISPPAAPTSVAATDGLYADKVRVTWTASVNATTYYVLRDSVSLGAAGNVTSYDDTGSDPPVITPGTANATDGTSTDYVTLSVAGESVANGTTHAYTVIASNASGNSTASSVNNGYRGIGVMQGDSGQNKVRSLVYLDGRIYMGLYMIPAMVLSVNATTMVIEDYYEADTTENYTTALCTDGTYIYAATHNAAPAPSSILKIDPVDMSLVDKYAGVPTYQVYGRAVYYDPYDGHVYGAFEANPGSIVKLNTSDMSVNATWTGGADEDFPVSLVSDATYLYAALFNFTPGKLIKITKSTMVNAGSPFLWTGETDEDLAYVVTILDGTLYLGLETSPGMVMAIDPDTMETTDSYTASAGKNEVHGLVNDGEKLVAGFDVNPAVVEQIDPATMTATSANWTGSIYEYNVYAMVYESPYIYIGFDSSPGRLKVLDSATLGNISYQWQRSAADSDADYSAISGAIVEPYNDTEGVPSPDGRYYKCLLDAISATQQATTADRGYKLSYDIVASPVSLDLGIVNMNSAYYAKGNAPGNPVESGNCTFIVTNTGSVTTNITINMADLTGGTTWVPVGSVPSANEFRMTAYYAGQDPASGTVLNNSAQAFYNGLASSANISWDFKFETGTWINGDVTLRQGKLQLTAVAP